MFRHLSNVLRPIVIVIYCDIVIRNKSLNDIYFYHNQILLLYSNVHHIKNNAYLPITKNLEMRILSTNQRLVIGVIIGILFGFGCAYLWFRLETFKGVKLEAKIRYLKILQQNN